MKHLEAIRGLMRRYPTWDCPPATIEDWLLDLDPLPEEAVQAACRALGRESEFPPSLAAIFKRASILARPAGSGAMTAGDAWAELQRNRIVLSQNRYESRDERRRPYTWTSEAARAAAESVDWKADWEGETTGTIRAQFERYYLANVARQAEIDWRQEAIASNESAIRLGQRGQAPRLEQ